MIAALAWGTALSADPTAPRWECVSLNRTQEVSKFSVATSADGTVLFRAGEGNWPNEIDGGRLADQVPGATRVILTSPSNTYELRLEPEASAPRKRFVRIRQVDRNITGAPVTIAAGVCSQAVGAGDLKRLPPRGELPSLAGKAFPRLLGLHSANGMICSMINTAAEQRSVSVVITNHGLTKTVFQFYDAAWINKSLGDLSLPTVYTAHPGAGVSSKERITGTTHSSPAAYNKHLGIYWHFDYYNQGEAEPEIDLALALPKAPEADLYAGMCQWTDDRRISTGNKL